MAKAPVLLGTDQTWPVEIPAGGFVDVTVTAREYDSEELEFRVKHADGQVSDWSTGAVDFADETPENLTVEVSQVANSQLRVTVDPANPMRFRIEKA